MTLLSDQKRIPTESARAAGVAEVPDTILFWSGNGLDRYRFLDRVVSKISEAGWRCKTDTGWTGYDVEITADPWTRLRLTTVSEELEQGRKNIRCRIRGSWTLPAKALGSITLIAVVWLVWSFASGTPWVWMSLPAVPLLCWFLDEERQAQENALATLIANVAGEAALVRLPRAGGPESAP